MQSSLNTRLRKIQGQTPIDDEISKNLANIKIEEEKKKQFLESIPLASNIINMKITNICETNETGSKFFTGIQEVFLDDYTKFKSSLQTIGESSREILLFNELEQFVDKNAIVLAKVKFVSGKKFVEQYARCRIIEYSKNLKKGCFEDIDTGCKQKFDNTAIIKQATLLALSKKAFATKFILDSDSKDQQKLKVDDFVKIFKITQKTDDGYYMASLYSPDSKPKAAICKPSFPSTSRCLNRDDFEVENLEIGVQKVPLRFLGNDGLLERGLIHICENTEKIKNFYQNLRCEIEEYIAEVGKLPRYIPLYEEIVLARYPENNKFYRCEVISVDINYATVSSIDFAFAFKVDYENVARLPKKLKLPIVSHTCKIVLEGSTPTNRIDVGKTIAKLQEKNSYISGIIQEGREHDYEILFALDDVVLKKSNNDPRTMRMK